MCLLAVLFRVTADAHLIVGANREESYARGGTVPELQAGEPAFVAGRDPVAGGTWLGVNACGLVVAVTNRPRMLPTQPRRSRGLLVRDLLACRSANEAMEQAGQQIQPDRYAGCNLLCADRNGVYVIRAGDWLRIQALPPGVHVLSTGEVNQVGDPRVEFALERLRNRQFDDSEDAVASLRRLCAHTAPEPAIVHHGTSSGTVSSTVLALREPMQRSTLYHAQGSPDKAPYHDLSTLMLQLAKKGCRPA